MGFLNFKLRYLHNRDVTPQFFISFAKPSSADLPALQGLERDLFLRQLEVEWYTY